MMISWIVLSISLAVCLYLVIMVFYFKALLNKEKQNNLSIKNTLDEAEIIIRKYQLQLQKALGSIDTLSDELQKLKSDLKSLRTRNAQLHIENAQLHERIQELEARIEALL